MKTQVSVENTEILGFLEDTEVAQEVVAATKNEAAEVVVVLAMVDRSHCQKRRHTQLTLATCLRGSSRVMSNRYLEICR
jgi:hypothetical protein